MVRPLVLRLITASVYRAPIDTPVQTSFGVLHDRASVLVRIVDDAGTEGWGEIWCNFPSVGAEHRARLLCETVAPLAMAQAWLSPATCHKALTRALNVLAIQSGEPGPIAQVLAGLDLALWDLVSKRAGLPLWKLLGGQSPQVRVYASGLNPTDPDRLAAQRAEDGHRAFKLKVGFGADRDIRNLANLRRTVSESATLMVDANQAWQVEEAVMMSDRLAPYRPLWLEEPIAADEPLERWRDLAARTEIPLAAGENLRGREFIDYLDAGVLKVLQPDVAKWGGFSGCLPLGKGAAAAAAWLCPHWLGAGVGLLATLHLKAAIGGEGFAEVDANANPLRELLAGGLPGVHEGTMTLSDCAGLGAAPDLDAAARFLVAQHTVNSTNDPIQMASS